MKPRLVRILGSARTETFLDKDGLTIGREPTNDVRVDDPVVSSQHCRIRRETAGFILTDFSKNGTFVNGKPAVQMRLMHGDEIAVGRERFYFLIEADDSVIGKRPPAVHIEEVPDELGSCTTVILNPANSAYLRGKPADDSDSDRMAHDMSVLLRLSGEINAIDDSDRVQRVLLERIFEIVPAESGVILLGSEAGALLQGTPISLQKPGGDGRIRVSTTVTQQVFSAGEAMLRNDLLDGEIPSESIAAFHLHSVLCVPLSVMNLRVGVLYLATTDPLTPFDRRHLELVTAIAGIAALALEHARYVEWLEVENRQLTHAINLQHGMIGDSPRMQKVYESISLVAPTDSPVLILGESGTGKELAARAIHNNSNRRNGPFVVVNCGAIAETLFATHLFGYVKGAFTGAERDQRGFVEEADGGTLFLDELGELPVHCQAALLRVLEDKQILRVGSTKSVNVDMRLISATNRSLKEEIQKGGFRADLYYRMGLPLEMPPLRDRIEDMPLLVKFFLSKHKQSPGRELGPTPPETIRILQDYAWPGNVRELSNAIRWAVVFGKSDRIRPEDLPPDVFKKTSQPDKGAAIGSLDEAMASFERQFILRALEETRGNVVEAAGMLARAPNYLQRRISQLNLRDDLERIRSPRQ